MCSLHSKKADQVFLTAQTVDFHLVNDKHAPLWQQVITAFTYSVMCLELLALQRPNSTRDAHALCLRGLCQ